MIKDTILLSSIINWLVINSVLVVDNKVPCIYRVLPKHSKRLIDALENQEREEI
jgi:hypothetical protein